MDVFPAAGSLLLMLPIGIIKGSSNWLQEMRNTGRMKLPGSDSQHRKIVRKGGKIKQMTTRKGWQASSLSGCMLEQVQQTNTQHEANAVVVVAGS